jgi:protein phosphatase 1 regulatory subunit 7
MADPADQAPPTDPAAPDTSTHEAQDHKPRDSKGWDGKLRLDKSVQLDGPYTAGANSDPEASEDEDKDEGPAPEQLAADEDLLDDVPEDEDQIDLVHMRVSSIPALRLERFRKLKRLCLRQNQITDIELPDELAPTLVELDLYDNLISHMRGFDAFTELESLDLSFNKIKHIKRVAHLTKLKDIYFVQNKIGAIEGLDGLSNLRQVELGANRIRVRGVGRRLCVDALTCLGNTKPGDAHRPRAALARQEQDHRDKGPRHAQKPHHALHPIQPPHIHSWPLCPC